MNRYYFIRKHHGRVAFHAFRVIMSLRRMLRLLKFLIVWLVNPSRRPEAKAKIWAPSVLPLLLGLAARPDEPPDELRRESTDFNFVPAVNPEVGTG